MKKYTIIEKPFREWSRSSLKNYIGIIQIENFTPLNNWLAIEEKILKDEILFLNKLAKKGRKFIDTWNETELREKFIIDVTKLVDFENEQYDLFTFSERSLSAIIRKQSFESKLSGTVDWMIALGDGKPCSPFFFIHEYKAEESKTLDGRGQLLAAMVVAQELNQIPPSPTLFAPNPSHFYKDMPIYGVYISGRSWFFVALKGTNYGISSSFDATKEEDLQAIFKILKAQKQLIYSYLENT